MIETLIELITLNKKEFEALKHLKGNRPLNPTKYNKYRRELEQDPTVLSRRDWIIIVNKEGEIIDGQNHWKAVMEYNRKHKKCQITSMQCTVEEVSGLAAVQRAKDINNSKSKWTFKEYLESYIELGYVSYIRFKNLMQHAEAKGLSNDDKLLVCSDFEATGLMSKFNRGEFVIIREDDDIVELMGYLSKIRPVLVDIYGPSDLVVPAFLRCSQIPDFDMERFIDKLKKPTKDIHYEKHLDDILKNFNKMYNHKLDKNSQKRTDIVKQYAVVTAYNFYQEDNATRTPTLKDDYNFSKPKKATKHVHQEDDPDPDNDAAVRISVKDTGEIEKEVLEQQEAKRRGRMAAKQKIEDVKGTLGDKLSHIFSNGPDEDPDGDETSPV